MTTLSQKLLGTSWIQSKVKEFTTPVLTNAVKVVPSQVNTKDLFKIVTDKTFDKAKTVATNTVKVVKDVSVLATKALAASPVVSSVGRILMTSRVPFWHAAGKVIAKVGDFGMKVAGKAISNAYKVTKAGVNAVVKASPWPNLLKSAAVLALGALAVGTWSDVVYITTDHILAAQGDRSAQARIDKMIPAWLTGKEVLKDSLDNRLSTSASLSQYIFQTVTGGYTRNWYRDNGIKLIQIGGKA